MVAYAGDKYRCFEIRYFVGIQSRQMLPHGDIHNLAIGPCTNSSKQPMLLKNKWYKFEFRKMSSTDSREFETKEIGNHKLLILDQEH